MVEYLIFTLSCIKLIVYSHAAKEYRSLETFCPTVFICVLVFKCMYVCNFTYMHVGITGE